MKRLLTAAVAVPILLFCIWTPNPYFFVALALAATMLGLAEFNRLAAGAGFEPIPFIGYPAAALIVAAFALDRIDPVALIIAGLVLTSLGLSLRTPGSPALARASSTVFGVVYVAVPAGFLVGVRMVPDTPSAPALASGLLTTFFAIVILTDTGAYYSGRALGRRKLAPAISPGKTVEGAIGGFVAAIGAALLAREVLVGSMPILHAVVLGAVISTAGQIGDLAESLLKRGANVKDSGVLFPGHGGMLDRVDSVLFAAPFLYCYSRWFAAW